MWIFEFDCFWFLKKYFCLCWDWRRKKNFECCQVFFYCSRLGSRQVWLYICNKLTANEFEPLDLHVYDESSKSSYHITASIVYFCCVTCVGVTVDAGIIKYIFDLTWNFCKMDWLQWQRHQNTFAFWFKYASREDIYIVAASGWFNVYFMIIPINLIENRWKGL